VGGRGTFERAEITGEQKRKAIAITSMGKGEQGKKDVYKELVYATGGGGGGEGGGLSWNPEMVRDTGVFRVSQ